MSDLSPMPVSDIGITLNTSQALLDAEMVIRQLGQTVKIRLHEEQKIERDRFNSIKNRKTGLTAPITFYAYPIIYNPTDKQLEDAGVRERTEVLIKTAVLDWLQAGFTVDTLKDINSIRAIVEIKGAKYEIKTKQLDSQYGDTFLYIHLGLNRV